jgi:hypothetical protein
VTTNLQNTITMATQRQVIVVTGVPLQNLSKKQQRPQTTTKRWFMPELYDKQVHEFSNRVFVTASFPDLLGMSFIFLGPLLYRRLVWKGSI